MKISRIVFAGKGRVEIGTAEIEAKPGPSQVLIETAITMVSPGTELAALTGTHSKSDLPDKPAWLSYPSMPGYLACGIVIETGAAVKKVKKGERVLCEGAGVWNSHVSHLLMEEGDFKLIPIGPGTTFEEAVFSKMGSIAMTGVRVLHMEFGDTVAVLGLGLVGQLAARLAAIAGAGKVVGVDPMEERRKLLAGIPGITAVSPEDPILKNAVAAGQRLSGFDHVIEASGHPKAFQQACEIARVKGKIAVLSSPHKFFEIRLYDHIHSKGLQVLGAHGFVLADPPNVTDTWTDGKQRGYFLQLLSEKRISVAPLISHKIRYTQAPEIYRGLMESPSKYLAVQFVWKK
jgi:2-desacetyl-2-hydroxyethyl bacteriochlorophyllide A dehydrogenase